MTPRRHWSLGTKLTLVAAPFLVLALLLTSATLWVSWQLDGGAAAVNEAGRMRMQVYRLALSMAQDDHASAPDAQARLVQEFETSLTLLRQGDAERPLFVPWDTLVAQRFETVVQDWIQWRALWQRPTAGDRPHLSQRTRDFVGHIEAFVSSIEHYITRWSAILHLLQTSIMAVVILGTVVLLYVGYRYVLEPVGQLKQAIDQIEGGNFNARVVPHSSDEFGALAEGFNTMATHLQALYRNLEGKVAEKTAELEEKRERLESLYEVTALVARATSLDELAQSFSHSVQRIAHADAVALRWSDQTNQRYLLMAANGLPGEMMQAEHCIYSGECECGNATPDARLHVIPIHALAPSQAQHSHCAQAGFETVITIPIRLHERLMGEIALFFHARVNPGQAERSLLEALASHLASAMENLRLNALEKEAAVAQERNLLARELHDSIAQSLAFLKIQVQLMRDAIARNEAATMAQVLDEIDAGVRESYGDVRELLLHFRTRANSEDIEPALATTLRKFEHQSGVKASLDIQGHGLPLPADVQTQVLHIVQEALSNVRKHARASHVWVDVQQQPVWRFEIRDNGEGFEHAEGSLDETHVGLRIMSERAERIGAQLDVLSTRNHGCSVILTLPPLRSAPADPGSELATPSTEDQT